MKNPNGFGSVYKLPGNRRKPWAARITVSHDMGKYKYKYLGYYETQQEALIALAEYNRDPYSLDANKITLGEVYDSWYKDHCEQVSPNTLHNYHTSRKHLEPLMGHRIADLKLKQLQSFFDILPASYQIKYLIKVTLSQVYDHALKYEIVEKNYSRLVDIAKFKKDAVYHEKKVFSPEEIDLMWKLQKTEVAARVAVILLYTGIRISEFLDLKEEDVDIQGRVFYIRRSKTPAGIRSVPIAEKIVPLFESLMTGKAYLYATPQGSGTRAVSYHYFQPHQWATLMNKTGLDHTCHETRHTFISLLANRGVDERIIKRIVGHVGSSVTENVYTHFEHQTLLNAVNLL